MVDDTKLAIANAFKALIQEKSISKINVQDISSFHITRTLKCYNGLKTFYWMVFSLRNGHVVFSRVENNNEAKKMEGIVRKYISDLFRCQIKKED